MPLYNIGNKEFREGLECYTQQKYAEAEHLLQQLAQQREIVLGAEHVNTL
jgi:sulfur relay (sulfurtransferase) DsrC/TusE family protein